MNGALLRKLSLTATAAAVLFRWCRLRGASAAAATFAALTYALGTPVFPWSTIFFGHATAAAFLLIGFALLSNTLSGAQQRLLPPLARALHKSVDIGREVPAALYVAVAQVLTYVFQLRAARERDG